MDGPDGDRRRKAFDADTHASRHVLSGGGTAGPIDRAYRPSSLADWWPILDKLHVSAESARAIEIHARTIGVPFQVELMASDLVREDDLFRGLAEELGLHFVTQVEPEALVISERACLNALRQRGGLGIVRALEAGQRAVFLLAPDRIDIARMRGYIPRYPEIAVRLRIVPPSILRAAILHRARPGLLRVARDGLFNRIPACSARIVANAWQGVAAGALLVALPVCLSVALSTTTIVAHSISSLFFLACVALRMAASPGAEPGRLPRLKAPRPSQMPVYTVLVALYQEADLVPDLMAALARIVWPRSRIEVKLVCEADDTETLAAVRAQKPYPWIEVIEVPPEGPRTKPKALSYALPMCCGDFVVLYDAEDKPHPFQLIEAWQRFREGSEELACLQAPLFVSNRRENGLTALFALEYSALFRGILPWLARRRVVLPLGGTSNHFRREVLDNVGAWDAFNMTEDADLGLRLRRFGYHTETLGYPTFEDAPDRLDVWLPQRTRWFKGWTQTWLVHMRAPLKLLRDLGPASFLVTQILFAGMVISALVHPFFLATMLGVGIRVLAGGEMTSSASALLILDTVNIAGGYAAFLVLGWRTSTAPERRGFWKLVLMTPVYWSLMSLAAWWSIWQLYKRPHFWAKTPHKPSRFEPPPAYKGDRV